MGCEKKQQKQDPVGKLQPRAFGDMAPKLMRMDTKQSRLSLSSASASSNIEVSEFGAPWRRGNELKLKGFSLLSQWRIPGFERLGMTNI